MDDDASKLNSKGEVQIRDSDELQSGYPCVDKPSPPENCSSDPFGDRKIVSRERGSGVSAKKRRVGRSAPRPVGWQAITIPKLTRRTFLAGTASLPAITETAFANSPVSMQLELDLSADRETLTIREFPQPYPGQKLDANLVSNWAVIAKAFGPKAWFDLAINAKDETEKHLIVRKASFGDASDLTLDFLFKPVIDASDPDKKRVNYWVLELKTDLWRSAASPYLLWTSGAQPFRQFVKGKGRLNSPVNVSTTKTRLGQIFDGRVTVVQEAIEELELAFNNDCLWHLSRKQGVAATSFDGFARAGAFALGWYKTDGEVPFLAGFAKGNDARVAVTMPFPISGTSGVSVSIRDFGNSGALLEWEVRQTTSPLVANAVQTFSKLTFGTAEISLVKDSVSTVSPISAARLFITECRLPTKDQRVRRTLWGAVTQLPKGAPFELRTPVGRLNVNAPEHLSLPNLSAPEQPAQPSAQFSDALVASGDRSGAQDASIWMVFDRIKDKTSYVARRIAVDLTLLSSDLALPDVSYSKLSFDSADFRLVYEDGEPMKELSAGEFPRQPTSSYLWIGPLEAGKSIAHFDLSRATLTVTRDIDLVKLRFRFLDLELVLTPWPVIRPAHADCRVIDLGNGLFRDDRPVLVAEFDPQHVFEEAIFRQNIPLPDVTDPVDVIFEDTTYKDQDRNAILQKISEYAEDAGKLVTYRKAVRKAKILKQPTGEHEFEEFSAAFEKAAMAALLPAGQQIYVGPFALDPDVMAIARRVKRERAKTSVTKSIDAVFQRIGLFIEADKNRKTHLLAPAVPTEPGKPGPDDYYVANALRNETILEQQEPVYGVFRDYYRSEMIRRYYAKEDGAPATLDTLNVEYFAKDDRPNWQPNDKRAGGPPKGPPNPDPRDTREETIRKRFIEQILGDDPIAFSALSDARLSQPSRLAFHVNCAPVAGVTAEEAGLNRTSGASPQAPNSGRFTYPEFAFTFAALTDWSRHEPAVTLRARKLFSGNSSGIVPPIGARAANLADGDMLAYQGIARGPATAEQRLGEIRASLAKKPTPYETAIEIPARLTLSTAQDAIWFDKRKMPWQVVHESGGTVPSAAPVETSGSESVMAPGETIRRSREPLWIARLALDGLEPNLRIVDSPDLRLNALTWLKPGTVRQIGGGAPPRGPLAPWFIGPEQMDSATLTAAGANANLPPGAQIPKVKATDGTTSNSVNDEPASEGELCTPPLRDSIWRMLRLLCGRDEDRDSVAGLRLFRAALDAYDRHELVLLSSAYGLPVIGKRKRRDGYPPESEVAGGLVPNSGQIEPGDEFPVLDADDAQAIQRPQPLRVRELWLSALGGSLIHDTKFFPSAGANNLWGGKIFDGFSIQRWRAEIVLGRDIVGEVIYKGYLFPLGHRASLVKLTERLFLRSETQGVKAVLVQRIFVRVGRKTQPYPAVGQPFDGRLWCARNVTILTEQTPDLQDPYEKPKGDPSTNLSLNPENPTGGRIGLGDAPGLAFWPRVNETDEGLVKFDLTIDGAETSMPLIFVDNIAATNSVSLQSLVETYRRWSGWKPRRTVALRGQNIRYARETKTGDCTLKTQYLIVSAHGRLKRLVSHWNGDLTAYDTTPLLEGAEQAPFYPCVETAKVRLDQVERFSGGGPRPVDVQYDGRYVRFGFPDKTSNINEPTNPLEVFLNLRTCVAMLMDKNGDRSGAVGRPDSNIVAIGRGNGPIGASGTIIFEESAPLLATGHIGNDQRPAVSIYDGARLIPEPESTSTFHDLWSLADFFDPKSHYLDEKSGATTISGSASALRSTVGVRAAAERPGDDIRKVLRTFFSDSAKILGVVTLRELLQFLGFNTTSLLGATPILRETLEFGSGASTKEDTQLLVRDIHAHVLAPLKDVVQKLQKQWQTVSDNLKNQFPGRTGVSLSQVFPEIDSGLTDLLAKLRTAEADSDPVGLAIDLSAIYESARAFAAALDRVASNPVARLQAAAIGTVQSLLTQFLQSTTVFKDILEELGRDLGSILNANEIGTWIEKLVTDKDNGELSDTLTLALIPPDIAKLAQQTAQGIGASLDAINNQFKKDLEINVSNFARDVIADILAGKALDEVFKNFRIDIRKQVNTAVKNAKQSIPSQFAAAQPQAVFIIVSELDDFAQSIEPDGPLLPSLRDAHRAVAFVVDLIGAIKKLRGDIGTGDIQKSISDLAALSDTIFGIGEEPLQQINQFLKGAFLGLKDSALTATIDFVPTIDPAFSAEVTACTIYEGLSYDQKKGTFPNLNPNMPATFEPMITLDAFLSALKTAQATFVTVSNYLNNATNLQKIQTAAAAAHQDVTPSLKLVHDFQELLNGSGDLGLVGDASALYCAVVKGLTRMGAAVAVIKSASWDEVNKELVGRAIAYEQACGQSATAIGDALADAIKHIVAFVEPNKQIKASEALLAGALDEIAKIPGLDSTIRQQLVSYSTTWKAYETDIVAKLCGTINVLIRVLKRGATFASAVATKLGNVLSDLDTRLQKIDLSLQPEKANLQQTLRNLSNAFENCANYIEIPAPPPKTIVDLLAAPVVSNAAAPTVRSFFAGTSATFKELSVALHDAEAAVFAEWRTLQARATGLPQYLQRAIVIAAQAPLKKLNASYALLHKTRNDAAESINSPLLSLQARRALFASPAYASQPSVDINDPTDDDKILKALEGKDRLAEEVDVLNKIATYAPPAQPPDTIIGNFVRFTNSWVTHQAAPIQIALNVQSLASEVLKGEILALIDVAAFRDAILDAIAQLVPTKAVFSYDFASVVTDPPDEKAIFQAQIGARFVLTTRVEVDLLNQGKTEFTAAGSLGPFAIKLVGSIVDALTLRFGGASFVARGGAAPRFDVSYDSYEIGPALSFVKELQSYLTPSDGAGFHIGPLDWALGIEAGYGVNLGSIGIGEVSFFNIIFDVSADLPFTNDPALFKTSLGTRLSPFTISIAPYAGSGYFSIYSSADGIRGFEASFLFGGGGSLQFGPLVAQVQIQVGTTIRILKVGNVNSTEIAGTFLAAGSMTIWIFNFTATLYVSLGEDNAGHMYGEAIFTFSFSAGFIDYSYSISASHDQPRLGGSSSGGERASELEPDAQTLTRFATFRGRDVFGDAADPQTVAATDIRLNPKPPPQTHDVVSKAICQSENWEKFASYFDFSLVQ